MLSLTEKLLLTEWAVAQGIRVFWIEHDRVGRWLRWNPWLPRLRRLSRLATTIVVSDLSKRIYVKELGFGPEHIVVIPNGIDTKRFLRGIMVRRAHHDTAQRVTLSSSKCDTLHIGTIARLSPEKGVDLLIGAIKDLPNVHLTIVGTGREKEHLQQLAQRTMSNPSTRAELGAGHSEQRITFIPSVPDVAAFYHSLDLFVLPSRDHDPCPLAPMEAMACGTPVIMTDACGTAEYVENGKEAIVVPAGSSGAIREAIERATSNEQRAKLSRYGMEAAKEKFSLERMVGKYEKLLRG